MGPVQKGPCRHAELIAAWAAFEESEASSFKATIWKPENIRGTASEASGPGWPSGILEEDLEVFVVGSQESGMGREVFGSHKPSPVIIFTAIVKDFQVYLFSDYRLRLM